MARPGTVINVLDTTPPRSAPVGVDAWFITGFFEKGPTAAQQVRGMTELEEIYGLRQGANPVAYDSAEAFFREGGSHMYVSRVVGPAPVKASTANMLDGSAVASIKVVAKTAGAWGNLLNAEVIAGGTGTERIIIITHDTYGELERTLSGDKAGLIAQSAGLKNADIVSAGAGTLPAVVAPVSMTAGADDFTNATEVQWTAALDLLTSDLGPGQVSAPGRTTSQAHTALLAHAERCNRIALLDVAQGADKAALRAAATATRVPSGGVSRYGAMFAPWAIIPGVAPNTLRTIPYSAIEAGMMARTLNPNQAVAGVNGRSRFAVDLVPVGTAPLTDQDREDLNYDGVSIARIMYDGVRTYGYRSLADRSQYAQWVQLTGVRLFMEIKAKCEQVLERHVFAQMDGRGFEFSSLNGDLKGEIAPYWNPMDALYGATSEEAFHVDTGSAVNTPESIANGQLKARVSLRVSPFAEEVILDLVNQRITEAL